MPSGVSRTGQGLPTVPGTGNYLTESARSYPYSTLLVFVNVSPEVNVKQICALDLLEPRSNMLNATWS